ncbi:MAG TPA: hypothetical protein DDX14_04685, partial [Cyanobacteria bacterium UBA9579]|nr:hypothetical protein [Cyanobacteria bacterium UBA9579]
MGFKIPNKILYALVLLLLTHNQVFSSQLDLNPVNSIELQLFNQNYINEPINTRLERIEKSAFGRVYSDNTDQRINRIYQIVNNSNISRTVTSPDNNLNQASEKSATDYPAVTQLEIKVFHQAFIRENIYARLNRLEGKVFGTIFATENLADRLDRLKGTVESESNDLAFDEKTNTIYSTGNNSNVPSNSPINGNLSALEMKVLGQSFDQDLLSQRIDRLERKVFGATQSGMPDNRISRLNSAVGNTFMQPAGQLNQNQNFQGNSGMQGNSMFSSNFSDDEFFNDQSRQSSMSSSRTGGLLSLLQVLALPIISGFLNKGNQNTVDPNYYPPQYPNNYGYPYTGYNYPNSYPYPPNNYYG